MVEHFHFLHPHWLWAFAPLAIVLWLVFRQSAQGGDSPWRRLVDARLLPHLRDQTGRGLSSKLPLALLATGWLLAVLALAGPTWERLPQPVYEAPEARVIVLSLKQSMLASDIRPDRLQQARLKITDLLRRTRGEQTGLVVYASDAFTVTPLTDDTNTLLSQLRVLQPDLMPAQGDRPERGLALAGELLSQAGRSAGDIILLADSHGSVATRKEAKRLRQSGYRVSVLGLGTVSGAPVPGFNSQAGQSKLFKLNATALQDIADAGGGDYISWQAGGADLDRILGTGSRTQASQMSVAEDRTTERWLNRGPWLVVMLLPLAALAFRRGWVLTLVLVTAPLMQPQTLHAAGWSDLWQRPDQQAHTALQSGDYERAIEVSDKPEQQGEAQYRKGDFQAAAEQFAQGESADARYNEGNALARAGKLDAAIKAYDQALARNPEMEDAKFNRKLVADLLQQQQEDQQQDQQEQQENSDSKEEESSNSSESSDSSEQQDAQNEESAEQASSQQDAESGDTQEQSESEQQDQQNKEDASTPDEEKNDEGEETQSSSQDQQKPSSTEENDEAESQPSEFSSAGDEQQQQQASQAVNEARQSDEQGEPEQQENISESEDHLSPEERQQVENYLRRVPDDPGALLRRKFLYQYRQRAQQDGNQ